jgi:hypothetical protein
MSSLSIKYPNSVIWISGDANLSNIEWETMSVVDHHNPAQVNSLFMDAVMDMAGEQILEDKISLMFSSPTDLPSSTRAHHYLVLVSSPPKKNVCLLSPDRPYFFTSTLKLLNGNFFESWKFCVFLEPNGIILSITVENVFQTVNKYKNITNNNS